MILVKCFSATLAESLKGLSGIPSGSVAFSALSDLRILIISSLKAGGKSKLNKSGKMISFMVIALG